MATLSAMSLSRFAMVCLSSFSLSSAVARSASQYSTSSSLSARSFPSNTVMSSIILITFAQK